MKTELRKGEKSKSRRGDKKPIRKTLPFLFFAFSLFLLLLIFSACSELQKPTTEPFYSQTAPPQKKEFRWSNGKMPKSFDPAFAAAPPETDIVRAIFEGLTDTNPKTLETIPAVAEKWTVSDDYKTWTFQLRKDAKWSNGERVTANDFVRSWKRLAALGEKVPHYKLLKNIVGMQIPEKKNVLDIPGEEVDILSKPIAEQNLQILKPKPEATAAPKTLPNPSETEKKTVSETKKEEKTKPKFGVEAVDNFTLKVSLVNPDKNFPALVAHPVFRPIYGDGKDFEGGKLNASIVTSGAFRLFSIGQDGITLDRAEYFWNKDKIELERVRFVPTENAEKALEEYRAGNVDAVTNADFAPLALKLLEPYDDFRRTTHSAINFYEFNQNKKPFDDRRVREAMAISIERERLTEGEMEGASKPALSFMPFDRSETRLVQDFDKAKNLLAEAGFANGENFPTINLVINRNDVQKRIALMVAKMWKQNLNLNTEIHVKESAEILTAKETGDFDVLRRGEVLPTSDETANMLAIFAPEFETPENPVENKTTESAAQNETANIDKYDDGAPVLGQTNSAVDNSESPAQSFENKTILTEAGAMTELPAIPLYFPTSYSLVKPYIQGFEINTLDAPSLKDVKIDNDWQPKKPKGES
ncbi:MAG: peptide ABC transporter substrate-binding protein [Pyrinomonadaceae bacterium]